VSGWAARPALRPRFSTASGEIGGKGGGKDDQVGYDPGKKVKGRKIHALVDTEGLPDGGDGNEAGQALGEVFEVLGQAAISAEP